MREEEETGLINDFSYNGERCVCKWKIEFAVYDAPKLVDIGIQCLFQATRRYRASNNGKVVK